jgi:putative DNA primase/helicase
MTVKNATQLRDSGLSIIPIKPDRSKSPALSQWTCYQSRLPEDRELQKWFQHGQRSGVAIVGGKVSGGLEILDFDAPEFIAEWRQLVEEAAPGFLEKLPQVETPTGGLHVFYRCSMIEGNQKLAKLRIVVDGAGEHDHKGKAYTARQDKGEWIIDPTSIETRGEGGYVLTVGCPPACHPSGKLYKLINSDLTNIPTIAEERRAILLDCARSFNQVIKNDQRQASQPTTNGGSRAGDEFNKRGNIRGLLERHGWRYLRPGRQGELWARPGVDHTSATLYPDGGLYVFSSNAPGLDSGRVYSPFSLYGILEHGGNFKQAAKKLAQYLDAGTNGGMKIEANALDDEHWPDAIDLVLEIEDAPPDDAQPRNGSASSGQARQSTSSQKAAPRQPQAPAIAHAQVLKTILHDVTTCDFAQLAGKQPNDELKQKHYLVLSIQELLKVVKGKKFHLVRKNDFIFVFNGQYWREIDRETLRDFLGEVAEKQGIPPLDAQHYEFKEKLYKQFLAAAKFEQVEPDPDKVLINLLNGTFEITSTAMSIKDFAPEDFLRYQLPFRFDRNATAPRFQAYLDRVLPETELQKIVGEFFGYVFTRNLKLEKALLLYGGGANGKSVLFDVMNALLGRENTGNYSLSDLMQEHNRAQIANKLLNYGSEINASVTKDTFKNLVSGEPIMARLKYGNSFLMENYAKLCFNCNELPKDIEHTDAYFRRLVVVPFRVRIPDDEQDKDLARTIISEELSGVFNWLLRHLQRLLTQRRFTESKIVQETIQAYRTDSDSVAGFISEGGRKPEGLLKDVYLSYRNYCADSGLKPLGKQNFRNRLEAHGYTTDRVADGMRVTSPEEDP